MNPGRKIIPRIARITHITDEMVADQPGVEEAVRLFADFAGDSVLVGQNLKFSQNPSRHFSIDFQWFPHSENPHKSFKVFWVTNKLLTNHPASTAFTNSSTSV